MALTKNDIVDRISEVNGGSRKRAMAHVEGLLEIIKSTLESGEEVLVSGFGKFRILEKSKRRGRNPATRQSMLLRARRVVVFKCSAKLRKHINRPRRRAGINRMERTLHGQQSQTGHRDIRATN